VPVAFQVSDKSALLFDALLTRSNVPFQARAELLILREISYFSDQQSEQSLAFGRVRSSVASSSSSSCATFRSKVDVHLQA